jgi:imidazolonepropionase-like amidohydrolase
VHADLVVLHADPSLDAAAFSKVRYPIRGGKVIHTEL